MLIFYRIAILGYGLLISLFSVTSKKAKKFKRGRKDLFKNLKADIGSHDDKDPIIWVHAASLGEFEQGRPLIECIKSTCQAKVLLTFFSPSGYEVRKNYEQADWIHYLPLDTPKNAQKFVDIVNPKLVIFIKYEFWYEYLKNLTRKNIPVLFVSAIFRKNQLFMKRAGRFFEPVLKRVAHYFVQDEVSKQLISRCSSNITVTGDTRFDRVVEIASQAKKFKVVDEFLGDEKCFMIGSSWPSDLKLLTPFIQKYEQKFKFIIAPHNIREEEIFNIQKEFKGAVTYSQPDQLIEARVLIIDNMGMLSSLYQYADFVYIGGGLRGALHNTIEAAVYGVPVFVGRHENNRKFKEAMELVALSTAFEVTETNELEEKFEVLWNDPSAYEEVCHKSKEYVRAKTGATREIMKKVKEIL